MKSTKELEIIIKGAGNHYRIEILIMLQKTPNLSLEQITENIDGNIKTISEHTKKLTQAGLVIKKYIGKSVGHTLSPYGKAMVNFLKSF
jgi:DNA-binding transcriptional ArsR family regulator